MGALPIWNLAFDFTLMQSLMQTLTVNGPIDLHCTHNKSQSQTQTRSLTVNQPLGSIHSERLRLYSRFLL